MCKKWQKQKCFFFYYYLFVCFFHVGWLSLSKHTHTRPQWSLGVWEIKACCGLGRWCPAFLGGRKKGPVLIKLYLPEFSFLPKCCWMTRRHKQTNNTSRGRVSYLFQGRSRAICSLFLKDKWDTGFINNKYELSSEYQDVARFGNNLILIFLSL